MPKPDGETARPKGPIETPVFRSTTELRTALLASYPDAEVAKAPVVLFYRGRDLEAYPGWRWTTELIRRRSDWWPALGTALAHAVPEGGEMAQRALADLHERYPAEARVLLRWTEPLARRYPDILSTFEGGNRNLATIIGEQAVAWDATHDAAIAIDIYDGKGGEPVKTRIRTQDELEAALARAAKVGMPGPPEHGPWSWLVTESLGHPWLLPMIPVACAKFGDHGSDKEVRAMLDFFVDRFDLWRYVELLEAWTREPPAWTREPAKTRKPRGWTSRPRWSSHHVTLGSVVQSLLLLAREQAETKPIPDLG